MNDSPLVTCLCLTMKGREKFLRRAVDCFLAQTYKNRKLIIVADSWDDLESDVQLVGRSYEDMAILIPQSWFPMLRQSNGTLNIGQKRNLGCQSAAGSDLIAVWDDDDYSAPSRIEEQVKHLQQRGASVTAYDRMFFTDGVEWWDFDYPKGFAAGTSLCFTRDWWKSHPFDEGQYGMIGEDCRFITEAHQAGVFAPVACPQMYATIHSGNTSRKNTSEPGWRHQPGFQWKD